MAVTRRPSARLLRTVALPVLALAASACSRNRPPDATFPQSESLLRVENHHWQDVTVYVAYGGQRTRLGVATAVTTTNMLVPLYALAYGGEIRLVAHVIGAPTSVTTELLIVLPSQWIQWTLETDLRRSSVAVW